MEVAVEGAAHCSMPSCMQYDFLPTTCDGCQGMYCREHSSPAAHECRGVTQTTIVCPLCNQLLTVPDGVDPNVLWNNHSDTACTGRRRSRKKCNVCSTTLTVLNIHTCKQCNTEFCLKHRLQEDHPCTAPTQFVVEPQGYLKRDSTSSSNTNNANNSRNSVGQEAPETASAGDRRRYNQGDDVHRPLGASIGVDDISYSGFPSHVDAPDDDAPLIPRGKEGRLKKIAHTLANLCNYQERRRRRRRERNSWAGRERSPTAAYSPASEFPELSERARNTTAGRRTENNIVARRAEPEEIDMSGNYNI